MQAVQYDSYGGGAAGLKVVISFCFIFDSSNLFLSLFFVWEGFSRRVTA